MDKNQSSSQLCSTGDSFTTHADLIGDLPDLVPSVGTISSLPLPTSVSGVPDSLSDCSVVSSAVDYSEFLLPQSGSISESPAPYIPDLSVPLSAPDPNTGQVTLANGWTPMFGRSSTLYGRSPRTPKLHDEPLMTQTDGPLNSREPLSDVNGTPL